MIEKISCIITTYNEEDVIEQCLKSIQWVDEIIIVDLGSKDSTIEKAKIFTKNIFSIPYSQYVEKIRNIGLVKASYNWILIIDPDEYFPPFFNQIAKELIKNKNYDAYIFRRRNYITSNTYLKYGYFYPDYQTRLFRNKKEISYSTTIHKQPLIHNKKVKIVEKIEIYHNYIKSKYNSFFGFPKFFRYISIEGKTEYQLNKSNIRLIKDIVGEFARNFYRSFIKLSGYKDYYYGFRATFLYSLYRASIPFYALYLKIIK